MIDAAIEILGDLLHIILTFVFMVVAPAAILATVGTCALVVYTAEQAVVNGYIDWQLAGYSVLALMLITAILAVVDYLYYWLTED